MKLFILTIFAAISLSGSADVMNANQRKFLENRRICVRRDTTTIPGSVISYYERNGKPDTKAPAVTTNVLHSVSGKEQNNAIQNLNEQLKQLNDQLQQEVSEWMAKSAAFSNLVVVTEGRLNAATEKIRGEIESLTEEKADLEEKIADSKYILLRPWLKTKLAAVEARIKILESLTTGNN